MGLHVANDRKPEVDPKAFVAPGAQLVGDVQLAAAANVWYNAVLRAEAAPISIGPQTNVQDGCILHSETGRPCVVGPRVTVGHGAILHGCVVGEGAVVGMGAIILNSARIGAGAVVAAGAVVLENQVIPPGMLVAGVPGRILRPVRPDEAQRFAEGVDYYCQQARVMQRLAAGPPSPPGPA